MNLQIVLSNDAVHRVGWCLVHFVWQGALVAAGLAVLLALLRKQSACLRYGVCCGALLLMAALPILTYVLQADATPGAAGNTGLSPVASEAAMSPSYAPRALASITHSPLKKAVMDQINRFLPWLCIGWMMGILALASHNVLAWFYLRRLIRHETTPLEGPWFERMETLRAALAIRRPVRLLQSAWTAAPMAAGALSPVVILPAAVLAGLTPSQIEAIFAHELAHIRRHDYLVNLVQTAIETFLFYHPAVWWVSRRIRDERENCCDDLAVRVCGNTLQYARALTSLAELVTAPAPLAVTATEGLFRRVQRIVGVPQGATPRLAPSLAGVFVMIGLLALALGAYSGSGEDLTPRVETLDIDTATTEDLVQVFGTPEGYVWNDKTFTPDNLPAMYLINFPERIDAWINNNSVTELRFYKPNYTFRGIRVGSTLDEVLGALGQPTQTVEGQPLGFYDAVLYKDIDGAKGSCYYAREDSAVRLFFQNYKVIALYVTRSDYTDSGRPPKVPGASMTDLTPLVDKINIDQATPEDLVNLLGAPLKYVWSEKRLNKDSLPANYIMTFPDSLDVWIRNGKIQELRFYEPNYAFRGKIRVGSTLYEVLDALGHPAETLIGQPNKFLSGVLYKNIDGTEGVCYYGRHDSGVRMFFRDYKVTALYVTRSDFK